MTSTPAVHPQVAAMRVLALTLTASPVLLLVIMFFVLPPGEGTPPTVLVTVAVLAMVGVGFVLAQVLGYRTEPLPAGLSENEAQNTSLVRYQTLMTLRFAMTEAPVIVALALAFVLDHGPWPFAIAAVVGIPSVAFHVLPTRRTVTKVQESLEADGSRSGLAEAFGW